MEVQENSKIYECTIEKYSIRFWKIFRSYLFAYSIIITLLFYFDAKNRSLITESCMLLITIFIAIRFYDVKKWVRTKIEMITLKSETYEFYIVEKDERKKTNIPSKNLIKKLKWIESRPKILKLTILNNEKEILNLYSCGKSEIEYELENIVYKLNNTNH